MVFGCGIDIEEIERFNKHYFDKGRLSDLVYDIFTTKEIENFSVFGKEAFLKGFCFKEAFYKAIDNTDISFKDIEIIFKKDTEFDILKSKVVNTIFEKENVSDIKVDFETDVKYVICKVLLIK